jgi:hypothetical protein
MNGPNLFDDGATIESKWADGIDRHKASLQIVNELVKLPDYKWLLTILQCAPKDILPEQFR